MNIKLQKIAYQIYPIFLPLLLLGLLMLLALSQLAIRQPALYIGITYDLMLVVPLLYLFLIRKRKIPKLTVVPIMVIGTIIAANVLPEGQQQHYNLLHTYLLPLVELGVLGTVAYFVYRTVRNIRQGGQQSIDMFLLIQQSTVQALGFPKIAKVFAAEAALFYYAFFSWKKRPLQSNEFTYHKKNGTVALLAVVILIALVETFAVHLLLIKWNVIVAWVLFGLSLYGAVMIFAQIKAILKRPHQITATQLILKNGLFGTANIPYHLIQTIEETTELPDKKTDPFHRWATLGELESPNIVLTLKENIEFEIMYGFTKKADIIVLAVDQPEEFVQELTQRMELLG